MMRTAKAINSREKNKRSRQRNDNNRKISTRDSKDEPTSAIADDGIGCFGLPSVSISTTQNNHEKTKRAQIDPRKISMSKKSRNTGYKLESVSSTPLSSKAKKSMVSSKQLDIGSFFSKKRKIRSEVNDTEHSQTNNKHSALSNKDDRPSLEKELVTRGDHVSQVTAKNVKEATSNKRHEEKQDSKLKLLNIESVSPCEPELETPHQDQSRSRSSESSSHEKKSIPTPSDNEDSNEKEDSELRRKLNCQVFAECNMLQAPCIGLIDKHNSSQCSSGVKNILLHLQSRSSYPVQRNKSYENGSFGIRRWSLQRKSWKYCENVELVMSEADTNNSMAGRIPPSRGGAITCMEFDSKGILFAVADSSGMIRIFDFDEVNAADLLVSRWNNRNDAQSISNEGSNEDEGRHSKKKKKKIKPFITFKTKTNARVSSIKWNPFNEDQLAVSFFDDAEIRLYDVSSSSNRGPMYVPLCRKKRAAGINTGNKAIHFFTSMKRGKPVISILSGGTQGSISLWDISNVVIGEQANRSKHLWELNISNEGISEIIKFPLSNNEVSAGLVFVACDKGSIVLLDIERFSRKSFSAEETPQILKKFHLLNFKSLQRYQVPGGKWMGINTAFCKSIVSSDTSGTTKTQETRVMNLINVTLVVNCGWVMSLQLDLHCDKSMWALQSCKLNLLHKSADIAYYNGDGEAEQVSSPSVSLPEIPTPAASLHGSLSTYVCVGAVKQSHKMLPHKDKKVMEGDALPIVKDQKNALLIIGECDRKNKQRGIISKIELPNDCAWKLATDPENQWIVVSTASSIILLHQF